MSNLKGGHYVDKTNCNWYALWFRNHDVYC